MRKGNLAKLYDRLTAHERLRLVIGAQARGDDAEVDRLVQSCPRVNYSAGDDAYVVPMKAALDITQAICHYLDREQGRLETINFVQCLISLFFEKWPKPEKKKEREQYEVAMETVEVISDVLNKPYQKRIMGRIKELLEGFEQFCQRELDLSHEKVFKAFAMPYWEWLEELKDEIANAEVDPDKVADFEKKLSYAWNLRVEGI